MGNWVLQTISYANFASDLWRELPHSGGLQVQDHSEIRNFQIFSNKDSFVTNMSFSPDGKHIAFGDGSSHLEWAVFTVEGNEVYKGRIEAMWQFGEKPIFYCLFSLLAILHEETSLVFLFWMVLDRGSVFRKALPRAKRDCTGCNMTNCWSSLQIKVICSIFGGWILGVEVGPS